VTREELIAILRSHENWLNKNGGERADLRDSDLRGVNLRGVDLRRADLRDSDLRDSDLRVANLSVANLRWADLSGANLRYADLSGANLRWSDLRWSDLRGADLLGATLPHFQICPEEGEFVAWKKTSGGVVKLLIPADAKRTSSLVGRKCRAEYAVVLEGEGKSVHYPGTEYRPGEKVYPDKYCDDIRLECSHGIHFFMTEREAEEW